MASGGPPRARNGGQWDQERGGGLRPHSAWASVRPPFHALAPQTTRSQTLPQPLIGDVGAREARYPAEAMGCTRCAPDGAVRSGYWRSVGVVKWWDWRGVWAGQAANSPWESGDSQAQSASSILVARSRVNPQVTDLGVVCCPDQFHLLAPHPRQKAWRLPSRPQPTLIKSSSAAPRPHWPP